MSKMLNNMKTKKIYNFENYEYKTQVTLEYDNTNVLNNIIIYSDFNNTCDFSFNVIFNKKFEKQYLEIEINNTICSTNSDLELFNKYFKIVKNIRNEIVKTDDLIKSCGADVPNIVRPPFGRFLLSALYVFCKLKKKVILWNIPTKDYKAKHPKLIVRKVYRKLKPGGIIVMHDAGKDNSKVDRSVSLQAVRSLLSELPQKGFRFVTISELLAVS